MLDDGIGTWQSFEALSILNLFEERINSKIPSPDFGELEEGGGGKQVFACHNFLDYSGEARKACIAINIEETMAILTR